jgi:hypothetical protein
VNDAVHDGVNDGVADVPADTADDDADVPMRMSSGPSAFHVNPLAGSSICMDEQPRSASNACAAGSCRCANSLPMFAKLALIHSRASMAGGSNIARALSRASVLRSSTLS